MSKYKSRSPVHRPTRVETPETVESKREKQHLAAELDDLLDEVDTILEENADVLESYVQVGGQ